MENILYCIRCSIFSHRRDASARVIWECLVVRVTARASAFSNLLMAFNLRERKVVVKRVTITTKCLHRSESLEYKRNRCDPSSHNQYE